jgi:hypothetical protein
MGIRDIQVYTDMKKILIIIVAFIAAAAAGFCQQEQNGALQDVTIKGELNLKVDSERPKLKMDFDTNDVVLPTVKTNDDFLNIKPRELLDLKASLSDMSLSSQTFAAYLDSIVPEPVVIFSPQARNDFTVSGWEFIVSDAKGESFHQFSGQGALPAQIVWSGRNSSNEMILPGKWYSYLVRLKDTLGRTHTVVGKPFNYTAILHQEPKGLVISISEQAVFGAAKESAAVTGDGALLLREAADIVKRHYTLPIKIEVYGDDKAVAAQRAKNVAGLLNGLLIFPDDRIATAGESQYVASHRVDIVIVNK